MAWLTRWRRRAAEAAGFDASDWLALAEAWVRLAWVSAALPRRARRALEQPAVNRSPASERFPPRRVSSERLHRLVAVAARFHVVRARCLTRAVVLQGMLARRGVAASLQVGVAREGAGVSGHAWLDGPGGPIGEGPETLRRFNQLRGDRPVESIAG